MALSLFGGGTNDPFTQMDRAIERAFDRYFSGRGNLGLDVVPTPGVTSPGDLWTSVAGSHPFDIIERDNSYEVMADAPGMNPEDIHIECQNGVLTIRGQHKEHREEKGRRGRVHRSERVVRSFNRSFGLPQNAAEDNIEASLDRGVLKVTVPKVPEPAKPQPKRIAVKPTAHEGGESAKQQRT